MDRAKKTSLKIMKENRLFKIVVAGEDLTAVTRAQKLSRRLAAVLKPELQTSNDAWKFEALSKLQTLKAASKAASKADLIIIAASGAGEPPNHVKNWVESSLSRKRKGMTALVAVGDHEDETPQESTPLCAYLRQIAAKRGMDFLTNSADGWVHNFEFSGT